MFLEKILNLFKAKSTFSGTAPFQNNEPQPANGISYSPKYSIENENFIVDKNHLTFAYSGNGEFNINDFYTLSNECLPFLQKTVHTINDIIQKEVLSERLPAAVYYNPTFILLGKNEDEHSILCYHPIDYKENENPHRYSLNIRFNDRLSNIKVFYNKDNKITHCVLVKWTHLEEINTGKEIFNKSEMFKCLIKSRNDCLEMASAYVYNNGVETRIFDTEHEEYLVRKAEYEQICQKLPDIAPKTLGGYTRMKNQNTKNFQKLKQLAEENNIKIL